MVTSNLDDNERQLICSYQGEGYGINAALRNGDYSRYADRLQLFDNCISKCHSTSPIVLYRATFEADIDKFVLNDIFSYPAYMSTAMELFGGTGGDRKCLIERHFNQCDNSQYKPVLLTIQCPAFFNMVPVYQIGDPAEREVLLGRNIRFKIVKNKEDLSLCRESYIGPFNVKKTDYLYHYILQA